MTDQETADALAVIGDQVNSYLAAAATTNNLQAAFTTTFQPTKDRVDLLNLVDNTPDTDKPISTATQTALDNLAEPAFGNVDDTSDTNKPISIATQSALNLKANSSQIVPETTTRLEYSEVNSILTFIDEEGI